ncbi:MAG: hypothetical protein K2L07_13330, partial [Lachnospiraceae bacterium]|nr:hypothetical protein [Lachnospiraceae bacterium]
MKESVRRKNKLKHAKDPRCCEENEDYYLNRSIVKAPTEEMVYYYQKVDGVIIKSEVTLYQWKKLYNYNRKVLRSSQKYYDDDYWRRFPAFTDDDGEEDDPLEHYADFDSRFCEIDNVERMDREKLLSKMSKIGRRLYHLYYVKGMNQDEIAEKLHTKQYRISRLLKELDEVVSKELLDDGERTETDIQVEYTYNSYRKTGKLETYEEVVFEDFLSNLQDWEEARLLKWFYSEKELYQYGIKFLIRYKYETYGERNIYRELFKLKDLQVRGYFMLEMTELPLKYQWLFIYLEQETEKRAERFVQPKEQKHEAFIKLLLKISKKAQMSPQQYFETKFLPFYHERMAKKHIEFASKELGVHFVKENDSRSI